jgi:hypothetical protein
LAPYRSLKPIVVAGRTTLAAEIERIEVVETPHDSSKFGEWTATHARNGVSDWYYGEANARDVTDQWINTHSVFEVPQKSDAIELLCSRFHSVAGQLQRRHDHRPTLSIGDEYDVQDLMHSLLRLFFDDVRPEEWSPSYAGKCARMDFLLPTEQVVIETKKTRGGLGAKEVGSQLIEDIARYQRHPQCKQLVCFVYDPESLIVNARGIERDLSREGDLRVRVFIFPRAD